MIGEEHKKEKQIKEMLEIVNITDKDFEKLNYKGKQEYFKTKTKLASVFHKSKDKNGIGITYVKKED